MIGSSKVHLVRRVRLQLQVEAKIVRQRGHLGRRDVFGLVGSVGVRDVWAEVRFQSSKRVPGGQPEEQRVMVELVPFGRSIPLRPQSLYVDSPGRAGPWMLVPVGTAPESWNLPESWRHEEPGQAFRRQMSADALLDASFAPQTARDRRNTQIQVSGEIRFDRTIWMRLMFQKANGCASERVESMTVDATLIAAGVAWTIERRVVVGAGGLNPLAAVRILEADRGASADERILETRMERA